MSGSLEEVLVAHGNARTNLFARRLIVERVAAGWPAAHVAEQLGVSRATVLQVAARHAEGGDAALADRSSRPVRMPARTPARVENRVLTARRRRKRGAVVLAAELGLNPSTVGRILARHQVPHLAVIDPITGERIRSSRRSENRYEHREPGAMIHVDVKKLGRIPTGGGWRLHGRTRRSRREPARGKIGYDYVHTAIDDRTRLAYSEIHADEKDIPAPVPAPRAGLVRHPRHPRATCPDRQRDGLPTWHRLGLGLLGLAAQTTLHQTRLPLDQRQSRTLQPHPAHRMGLRPPWTSNNPAPRP